VVIRRPVPPLRLPVTDADRVERAAGVAEISEAVAEAVLAFHRRER